MTFLKWLCDKKKESRVANQLAILADTSKCLSEDERDAHVIFSMMTDYNLGYDHIWALTSAWREYCELQATEIDKASKIDIYFNYLER